MVLSRHFDGRRGSKEQKFQKKSKKTLDIGPKMCIIKGIVMIYAVVMIYANGLKSKKRNVEF